jgi:hypothetical protein
MSIDDYNVKGPQDILLDLPQERLTSITRGHGPRRGNLERLLRYWRPIMKKPGGFTRCRVILKNHPELYPLERICAWLHHETTGKWPNEGCHHPGMKNCKGKLRKLTPGWSDADWSKRMRKRFKKRKKGLDEAWDDEDLFFGDFLESKSLYGAIEYNPVVTISDAKHASEVLTDFVLMEKDFISYLRDTKSWELVGEGDDGDEWVTAFSEAEDCGCE